MSEQKVLLELKKLKKYFPVRRGVAMKALEDISFKIYEGEKFGVVGESGCGKSTLGRVILQLYPQTSGACIYYGKSLEEMCPHYVEKEIAKLEEYQSKAKQFYQKSLELDKKIQVLQKEKDSLLAVLGSDKETKKHIAVSKKLSELEFKSKELRKDASRQLREGSRTVGSLILSGKLGEIKELFAKAQQETSKAHEAIKQYQKIEKEYEKTRIAGTADPKMLRQMEEYKNTASAHVEQAKRFRIQAWEYRGKDVLPITEQCLDPKYQEKLDSNYERGINLGKLNKSEMRELRREMQMIFQDPAASLDPRQSIGKSIEEVYVINTDFSAEVRKEKTMELLEKVGLKREHYYSYPHALSGGQKQRVGIARAIALDTKFIVLDESVSALDVSVQAQILQLLNDLSEEKLLTYFFITHDLGVVKHFCDRILVMYLGNVCEVADSKSLFHHPLHPYTESLLASVPRLAVNKKHETESVLDGDVPSAMNPPKGCPFHTRCKKCMPICKEVKPLPREVEEGHLVACHLHNEG